MKYNLSFFPFMDNNFYILLNIVFTLGHEKLPFCFTFHVYIYKPSEIDFVQAGRWDQSSFFSTKYTTEPLPFV